MNIPLTNCRAGQVASISPVHSLPVPVQARGLVLRGPQMRNLLKDKSVQTMQIEVLNSRMREIYGLN